MADLLRSLLRLTLSAALLFAAATVAMDSASAQSGAHRIVRVVNDQPISSYDVESRLRFVSTTAQSTLPADAMARIQGQVVENLIDEQLQLQEATRLGITAEDSEIQAAIARIEKQNNMEAGQLLSVLSGRKLDANTLIAQIRATLVWRKAVSQRLRSRVTIGEDDIDAYLDNLRDKGGTEYLLGEIFIAANNPSELSRARQTAERLLQELRRGAPFADIARQFSQAATAGSGGDTGWVQADQLETKLSNAIKLLRPGEATPPIGVTDGYYLLALRQSRTFGKEGQQETVYDLRRVFLPFPANASEQRKREILIRLAKARPGLRSCAAGEAYATKAGDPQKGNLGELRLADMPAGLQPIISKLKPGKISDLLRLQDGGLVMMLCGKRNRSLGLPTRDAVRDNLLQREADILARRYMRELRQDALIQVTGDDS